MRTKVCIAIVIACLAAASEAAAQYCELERLHARSEGKGVSAEFSSVDTSTCALGIETVVHVDGAQGVLIVEDECGPRRDHLSVTTVTTELIDVVNVIVSVYDRCLDTRVLYVTGTGPAEELHLSQSFKTASLRAALPGVDDSGQPVSIAIDLVWSGVGHREHDVVHVNNNGGTIVRFIYTSSGTMRDAVATGSVSVDEIDRTPLASTQGTIERNAARELTEYR